MWTRYRLNKGDRKKVINLEKVKLVLFDFDDTLCVHSKHKIDDWDEYDRGIVTGEYNWNNSSKNIYLDKFIVHCAGKGIEIGLTSVASTALHQERKLEWVRDNYGVILENYCVGDSKHKITLMKAIALGNKLDRDNILIVDDYCDTLYSAEEEGFQAATPIEVVNYVLENLTEE